MNMAHPGMVRSLPSEQQTSKQMKKWQHANQRIHELVQTKKARVAASKSHRNGEGQIPMNQSGLGQLRGEIWVVTTRNEHQKTEKG